MFTVVVVGGGWAGCAAAYQAAKAGCEVHLLERTDMLLGTGLVGGIMRNNGRYTVTEESIALGIGDIFKVIDGNCRHTNLDFPGHKHASLYDVVLMEPEIKKTLLKAGVAVHMQTRITGVELDNTRIRRVVDAGRNGFPADAFIDTTGTAGPINNCIKYGHGCAMCILRCHSFGGRVSLAARAGVKEIAGLRQDGSVGAMSGSCKLFKESLDPGLVKALNAHGVVVIPVPRNLVRLETLGIKTCQQYALPEYAENIVILDTGQAKLMSPFYPLELLRRIPGLKGARYEDPYSGGIGNSMRFFAMPPRDDTMKVAGVDNLFCAGEKAGLLVGHTEAIITGSLAGLNASRLAAGLKPVILPGTLAIGSAIPFVREAMQTEEGKRQKFTFSGSVLFERILKLGLYTIDTGKIRSRVEQTGLREVIAGNKKTA